MTPRLTLERNALELATGSVLEFGGLSPLPRGSAGESARAALEAILTRALRRPPCVVSFSGGRDSSIVLALATSVARRESLPLPVPVTLEFPQWAPADEHDWQSAVVQHLGLPDWQRIAFRDEMDIIGPIAKPVLRSKGLLWPFNAFFHVPIIAVARGGTVLSGIFGDEIMNDSWVWRRENLVAQRRARLLPADPVRLLVALGPRALRARFLPKRAARLGSPPPRPDWLRPDAFEAITSLLEDLKAQESLSFRQSVADTLWQLHSRIIGHDALRMLAEDADVIHVAPFADQRFLSALTAERGWRMFRNRTEAVRFLSGDLLPTRLVVRPTKASFDGAFFNRHSRRFAETWDGSGLDERFVDVDCLRRRWCAREPPDARTYSLLQQAWAAQDARSSVRQSVE